ncbi:MAG: hypothetical protein BGO55_30210 [Sphingobacteriales bacterium 50-39]|nr:hypothetical protein [Sphingobacteriales bacterium]OJW60800.1 MAG: hypothetical protein BGO55_30210 [Sphingobacteriales bacterium 50-39]
MRYSILYLLLFILPLVNWGCKKNAGGGSGSISGTWELREASAAMNPEISKYGVGNGNILAFTGNNYKIYKDGRVIKSGQFSIVQDATVETSVCLILPKGEYTSRIVYADSTAGKIFYQVTGNKLRFYAGCYAYDAGHSEVYERVSGE